MSTEKQTQYFYELTPDKVLQAVELLGEPCTGYCVALNSYENRVYEIELDLEVERHKKRKVVKFYRPGRWSREQILEEHRFLLELEESEIPVVAPVVSSQGETLHSNQDGTLFFAVFKKTGGRVPDELSDEQCVRVGRLMARIHATGNSKPFTNRWHLGVEKYL